MDEKKELSLEKLLAAFESAWYQSTEYYRDKVSDELAEQGALLAWMMREQEEDVRKEIVEWVEAKVEEKRPIITIYLYSICLNICPCPVYVEKIINVITKNKEQFTKNNLYFYAYQLFGVTFRNPEADTIEVKLAIWKLFREVYTLFKQEVTTSLERIPVGERNEKLIIVIAEQFLETSHGPTKTALDRCRAIMTKMNKEVFLICSNEVLPSLGKMPFCDQRIGVVCESNVEKEEIEWKGIKVPFFCIEEEMPDIQVINGILEIIRNMAPSKVVCIGGMGVLMNLVDYIVPCIDIGLCPSDLEPTIASYQTLGRSMSQKEEVLLQGMELEKTHVIESVFTSSLKPQEGHVTREKLGIPQDSFVIAVIGGRLYDEVDSDFLNMLNASWEDDYFVLFLGKFDSIDSRLENYDKINASYTLMMVDDILAVLEVCNLYVNPIRKGGGTSSVEAMYKGIPVVTTNFGDVSVNAGEDFWVCNYTEMGKQIHRYYSEQEFYVRQSEIARRRAEILLDTESELVRIMEEYDKRELLN